MHKYYKYRRDNKESIVIKVIGNSSVVNIVTSLGLFFGGLLFLLYYLHIGFMPNLNNFTDFTYLLFAMAIVGIFLFFILIALFVLPAVFYNKIMKNYLSEKYFIYSISIFPIIMLSYLIKETWLKEIDTICFLLCISILLFIVVPIALSKTLTIKEMGKQILYVFIQSIVSPYSIILVYTIFLLSHQMDVTTNVDVIVTFLIFSVVAIALNTWIIDEKFSKTLKLIAIIAIFTFIFLMLFFRTYALIPSIVMNQFHLGNYRITSVTAKQRSCKILSDLNISTDLNTSKFKTSSIDAESKTCTVKGEICILSSIGTTMLWQIDNNRTVRLPSEDFSGMVRNTFDNKRCVVYRHNTKKE